MISTSNSEYFQATASGAKFDLVRDLHAVRLALFRAHVLLQTQCVLLSWTRTNTTMAQLEVLADSLGYAEYFLNAQEAGATPGQREG